MPNIDLNARAADMGRAIQAGQLDPVDLTDAMLAAMEASPHAEQIYARTTPERARQEAMEARMRAQGGSRRGLLDGVPISWKDLFDTAGTAAEGGTPMLRGRVPERDAQVVANATAAGLVCLGKTHQTELAFSGLGVNPVTATPPNIHDPSLAPGGSSSGAAASTAFGLAAAGIGSDTGGSVRVPSVWNDLVGFKTSVGSLPMDGVIPLCPRFDTLGPLCRSVEDAAHLFAAMGAVDVPEIEGETLSGLRLLVLEDPGLPVMDAAPQTAFEAAVATLSAAGAKVETRTIPAVGEALPLSATLFPTEAYGTWGKLIEEKGDSMYPLIRQRFQSGKSVSGPQYVADWQTLERLRKDYRAATEGHDAVLLPTCPILPPVVADLLADADFFVERNLASLRNTRVGNLMNLAALTLPTGQPSCGLMVMVPDGGEARLLRIGAAMEKSL